MARTHTEVSCLLVVAVLLLAGRCEAFCGLGAAGSLLPRTLSGRPSSILPGLRASLATWEELSETVPKPLIRETPGNEISSASEVLSTGRMTLFRDRNGWCPYSERVWLAMLEKRLDFDEVLINLQGGKPAWYSSIVPTAQTPAIVTAEGEEVHDSARVLEYLEEQYPQRPLMPSDEASRAEAKKLIAQFGSLMPSGARPSSRAAFLIRGSGMPLARADLEASLGKIDGVLGERGGPFFMGGGVTMVDCVYAPFLERWRFQLPCMHDGLEPRGDKYPNLLRWYDAMEERVPAYASRVQGDSHTWELALDGAGGGPTTEDGSEEWLQAAKAEGNADWRETSEVWKAYADGRAGAAPSAALDAAGRLVERREYVVDDIVKRCGTRKIASREVVDAAMRVVAALIAEGAPSLKAAVPRARELLAEAGVVEEGDLAGAAHAAAYFGGRLCVPRDMGREPASELRRRLAALHEAASA